jgi:hypothetical protein
LDASDARAAEQQIRRKLIETKAVAVMITTRGTSFSKPRAK